MYLYIIFLFLFLLLLILHYHLEYHPVYLYNLSKIIQKLMTRDGMGLESAHEYFEFNMLGSWVGPGTPAFFYPKEDS